MSNLWNSRTGTSPAIVHFCGGGSRVIGSPTKLLHDQLIKVPLRPNPAKSKRKNEVTLITWNSTNKPTMLERCLTGKDIHHLTLRSSGEWKNCLKISLARQVLPTIKTKYIMGLDAFDVFLFGELDDVISRFEQSSSKMMLNSDYAFWPDCNDLTAEWRTFQETLSVAPNRYLNAGAWIAERDYCEYVYNDLLSIDVESLGLPKLAPAFIPPCSNRWAVPKKPVVHSEQLVFNAAFKMMHPNTTLDYDCRIFQVANFCEAPIMIDGPLL